MLTNWIDIPGWFWPPDQVVFDRAAAKFPKGSHFVEVGAFLGRSTLAVVEAISGSSNTKIKDEVKRKKIRFDSIDHFLGSDEHQEGANFETAEVVNGTLFEKYLENIKPYKEFINVIKNDSLSACKTYEDDSLELVYIDAAHEYEDVHPDLENWIEKVKPGGWLAGHDVQYAPVRQAVDELMKRLNITELEIVGASWWFEK